VLESGGEKLQVLWSDDEKMADTAPSIATYWLWAICVAYGWAIFICSFPFIIFLYEQYLHINDLLVELKQGTPDIPYETSILFHRYENLFL
jgi:hypothetical protein